jgi:hypothetical protein
MSTRQAAGAEQVEMGIRSDARQMPTGWSAGGDPDAEQMPTGWRSGEVPERSGICVALQTISTAVPNSGKRFAEENCSAIYY